MNFPSNTICCILFLPFKKNNNFGRTAPQNGKNEGSFSIWVIKGPVGDFCRLLTYHAKSEMSVVGRLMMFFHAGCQKKIDLLNNGGIL